MFTSLEFFNVVSVTYEIVDGKLHGLSVGDFMPVGLAFREDTKRWYYLGGFASALNDFNLMIAGLELVLDDAEDARNVAYFYFNAVQGPDYLSSVPEDELALQMAVSKEYAARFGAPENLRRFRRWWDANGAARRAVGAPRIRLSGDQFEMTYSYYTNERLLARRLMIAKDGTVAVPRTD